MKKKVSKFFGNVFLHIYCVSFPPIPMLLFKFPAVVKFNGESFEAWGIPGVCDETVVCGVTGLSI